MRFNLRNDFHNTETYILSEGHVSARQVAAARSRLCRADCQCPDNSLGYRGPQDWERSYRFEEQPDGSYEIYFTGDL